MDPKRLNSSVCETVMPIMLKVERDTRDEKEPGREERSKIQRSENERGLKNTLRKLAFH